MNTPKNKTEADLRNAPTVFRERIEALKKRGLWGNPKFKAAVLAAAEKIGLEQRAAASKRN